MAWELGVKECCWKLSTGLRCCPEPHGWLRALFGVYTFELHYAYQVSDYSENSLLRPKCTARRRASMPRHVENPSYLRVCWNPDVHDLSCFGVRRNDSFPAAAQGGACVHACCERAETVARRRAWLA